MKLDKNLDRWYKDEIDAIKCEIEVAGKSLIPHAPLGLARAIINCVVFEVEDRGKMSEYRNSIKYWQGRINGAIRKYCSSREASLI